MRLIRLSGGRIRRIVSIGGAVGVPIISSFVAIGLRPPGHQH